MRIVIADDSSIICDRLQHMLNSIGQVEIAGTFNNGIDTLNALKTLKPDLAIVDIKMPGLTGIEVLNMIRKENKTLQIIILSFHATSFYRKLALDAGANYFFSKVDDFEKVEMTINEILHNN